MLDLHTHILPSIDDGPSSMDESIEMARLAYEDGTRTIVLTPHNRDVNERSSISAVTELADEFREELHAQSIELKVLLGMENHLELDTPEQVKNGLAMPIEGTHYILIELPFEFYPFYTDEVLFRLQIMGLRPIIVHPERTIHIQDNSAILDNLVQKGALAQITASSITGTFGKEPQKSSAELLQKNLIHIISSDCHTAYGIRTPIISEGVTAAAKVIGNEAALNMVYGAPMAIVQDTNPPSAVMPTVPRNRWWRFGR